MTGKKGSKSKASSAEKAPGKRALAKAARREALIEATIDVIAQHGLSGTTMERVAKAAGASIGLANFHFETKERLLEAVILHLTEEERALWKIAVAKTELTPMERLFIVVDAWFDPRICNRRKISVWFSFFGDMGAQEIYRRVVENLDDERIEYTASLIEEIAAAGKIPNLDPYETAFALEACYDGLWLVMILYPEFYGVDDSRQRARNLVKMLIPGCFPVPAGSGRME